MVEPPFLQAALAAVARRPGVRVVTLFGSQARGASDDRSDVDFQVITGRPREFADARWLEGRGLPELTAYGRRPASGGVTKATAVFADGAELDVVVLPLNRLRLARALVAADLHHRSRLVQHGLEELARILRPGHRMLVGSEGWRRFLARVVAEVPEPRLSETQVHDMGACAFADYVSLRQKCHRGELLAAQRILHVNLAETNFRLMHEWRLRQGKSSFRDARRVEQYLSAAEYARIRIEATLTVESLLVAAAAALRTTSALVRELTGADPTWPQP